MLLSAEHITKTYGLKPLLQDVSLYLEERQKIALIGINGTGKSTLLRILAGAAYADDGTITVRRNARIAYLPQNPVMADSNSVLDQIFDGRDEEFRALNEYEARSMLNRLGVLDLQAPVGTLSGGQRKRIALVATLIQPAEILILDEPTNHLDSDMVIWLEDWLRKYNGGLIMVTHDRYFLERVADRIVELSHAALYTYEANYSKYLELRAERYNMAIASERKRQATLRREAQWIMRGARARGTKSKERIERYYDLLAQDAPEQDATMQMVTLASRLGKQLIELNDVSKRFGETCVLNHFSYFVRRNDRIGIVGHNGAGKSTLLNLIAGNLSPDSGSIVVGSTVRIGYFTQEGRELDPNQRVYDFISEIAGEVQTAEGTFSASQMLERFLFPGDLQYAPIGKLSGGERRRLYLLSILISAPNILLLDEPTNDLDIETLGILEDYLATFPGAVLAVSHDRYFLDKLATTIFEFGENGIVTQYSGDFTDYLNKRPELVVEKPAAPKPEKAPAPTPVRKRKLSFKEQREVETIDGELAELEAKLAALEPELTAAASDYVRLMELTAQQETLQAQLDAKTERWFELQEILEEIASQG